MKPQNKKILPLALASAALVLSLSATSTAKADSWVTTGSMTTARSYHTATLLPNGKVLVSGGTINYSSFYFQRRAVRAGERDLESDRSDDECALFSYGDPASEWQALARRRVGRHQSPFKIRAIRPRHRDMDGDRRDDERTLFSHGDFAAKWQSAGYGGLWNQRLSFKRGVVHDPAIGSWTVIGAMITARSYHTATLLPNGKVLVAGGQGNGATNNSELYDPATGTWTATGAMITARWEHTATLLPNGKVLVAWGVIAGGANLSSAEL